MLDQKIKHNLECKSESHSEHLCYIISQGFHLSDEKEFKALTENPRFECHHCNRIAKSEKNLCEPFDL